MSDRRKFLAVASLTLLLADPALAQPPASAPTTTVESLMDPTVEENLRAVSAAMPGTIALKTLRGRLANADKIQFNIEADAGVYFVNAVCDDACTNIDIRMLGPDGKVAHADEDADKFPSTRAEISGHVAFDVQVIMTACSKDPCAYAVRIYRRAPETAPAAK